MDLEIPTNIFFDFDQVPTFSKIVSSTVDVNVQFGEKVSSVARNQIEHDLNRSASEYPSVVVSFGEGNNVTKAQNFYTLLITENVILGGNFLTDFLRVALHTNSALVYSDFTSGANNLDVNRLPAWSPIRLSQLDYLGPCVFIDRNQLTASAKNLNGDDLRKEILATAVDLKATFSRIPISTYHQVDEFVGEPMLPQVSKVSNSGAVSIIIPTRGLDAEGGRSSLVEKCLEKLFTEAEAQIELEIVLVVDKNYSEKLTDRIKINCPDRIKVKIVEYENKFNFSAKCNLGAKYSSHEFLLFLNDDTEEISSQGIEYLINWASLSSVGAVGAQLRFEDDSIQHAGITLAQIKPRNAYLDKFARDTDFGDMNLVHEVSAVTGACFAIQRYKFLQAGMWDEELPSSYNDVDLCLKLNSLGYQSLIDNEVVLIHHESVSRDPSFDKEAFKKLKARWSSFLGNERYLRSEVVASSYDAKLGKFASQRINLEGKYIEYSQYLIKNYGFFSAIRIITEGMTIRMTGLLKREAHNYL